MSDDLTPYEEKALEQIRKWKTPARAGWFGKGRKLLNWPMEKIGALVMSTPGLGKALEMSFASMVRMLSDAAGWSVRTETILAEYRKKGYDAVTSLDDIRSLPLDVPDKMISGLESKYSALAVAEGVAANVAGALGIPADVVAVTSLNLRAIGEFATYYGFDVQDQGERLFVMNILLLASSPDEDAKSATMSQLVKISKAALKRNSWKQMQDSLFVSIVQKIARILGLRMTKAKLTQVLPVAGAAMGGGFNALYTHKVCTAAQNLYRERFLAEKYGEAAIAETAPEAQDLMPEETSQEKELEKLVEKRAKDDQSKAAQ